MSSGGVVGGERPVPEKLSLEKLGVQAQEGPVTQETQQEAHGTHGTGWPALYLQVSLAQPLPAPLQTHTFLQLLFRDQSAECWGFCLV